jgi:hypothetical protein
MNRFRKNTNAQLSLFLLVLVFGLFYFCGGVFSAEDKNAGAGKKPSEEQVVIECDDSDPPPGSTRKVNLKKVLMLFGKKISDSTAEFYHKI